VCVAAYRLDEIRLGCCLSHTVPICIEGCRTDDDALLDRIGQVP
jgi:hypothetical protein